MRLYRVAVPDGPVAYVGTHADATAKRMAYFEVCDVKKSDIEITPVDVPTDKAGLIAYLNAMLS